MSPEKITSHTTTDMETKYKVQVFDVKKDEYVTLASYSTEQEALFHAKNIYDYGDIMIVRDKTITYQTTYSMPVVTISNKLQEDISYEKTSNIQRRNRTRL